MATRTMMGTRTVRIMRTNTAMGTAMGTATNMATGISTDMAMAGTATGR